jgi:hypothetical protein
MAATVMTIWKDSFALDNKQAKWSYDMGVILKGFEGIWLNTEMLAITIIYSSKWTFLSRKMAM